MKRVAAKLRQAGRRANVGGHLPVRVFGGAHARWALMNCTSGTAPFSGYEKAGDGEVQGPTATENATSPSAAKSLTPPTVTCRRRPG